MLLLMLLHTRKYLHYAFFQFTAHFRGLGFHFVAHESGQSIPEGSESVFEIILGEFEEGFGTVELFFGEEEGEVLTNTSLFVLTTYLLLNIMATTLLPKLSEFPDTTIFKPNTRFHQP